MLLFMMPCAKLLKVSFADAGFVEIYLNANIGETTNPLCYRLESHFQLFNISRA